MTRSEILDNIRSKDKINVCVIRYKGNTKVDGTQFVYDKLKSKIEPLVEKLKKHKRFNVIETKSIYDITIDNYNDFDLIIPSDPHKERYCDISTMNTILKNRKFLFVPYAFDTDSSYYKMFKDCLIGICRKGDYNQKPNHIVETGNPFEEVLNIPKEHLEDPWKDEYALEPSTKKRILICPHWTLGRSNKVDKSDFLNRYKDICSLKEFNSEVDFIIRPHPLLYYSWCRLTNRIYKFLPMNIVKDIFNKLDYLAELFTIDCSENYVPYFRYSDAMIHDCGSFKCEYLYMDKPVCYMTNDLSMNILKTNHTEICKDAINSHELCGPNDSLRTFVQNVIDGNDIKRDIRKEHIEKYCKKYPNGKTPTDNIINLILGQEEYKDYII